MTSWRPDLTKLPPQRPADAPMDRLLEHVPAGGMAWLAFGNSGVTEMLMNWAHHVIELGYAWQMVVAVRRCRCICMHVYGVQCMRVADGCRGEASGHATGVVAHV